MVERILACGLLTNARYTLVDAMGDNIIEARRRLPAWAAAAGFVIEPVGPAIQISRAARADSPPVQLTIDLVEADCFAFAAQPATQGTVDLLIAHALLDLFDPVRALPQLRMLLKPAALFYSTINFDGNTILQPEVEWPFDDEIEAAYHATMDARMTDGLPSGDSRTGRHLFGHFHNAGLAVLDAGSSDWVVFGGQQGYPADEAYFLHFIVETMRRALLDDATLDPARFAAWIQKRHAQIERGELVYIAHQLDFLAQLR
jgi:SAM-dependent methyltransferase